MTGLPLPPSPQGAAASPLWRLGNLSLSFGPQAPERPAATAADLLIPVGQPLIVRQQNLQHILRPPLGWLYWPSAAPPLHTSAYKGWRLSVAIAAIEQRGSELSHHRLSRTRLRQRLLQALPMQPRHVEERDLASLLLQLLQLLPLCRNPGPHDQRLLTALGLDRALERLLVLLLCGDLLAQTSIQPEQGSRQSIFADLLSWIDDHLHQPLQLRDLVAQSGYSERSLRNFFQERFGCGPIQWIRGQRLEKAREQLLNPLEQDSVSSIAAGLGYSHLSQFSRDFQAAYRVRPSELLRESRRG
ncbi:MAG: helix-turn-helix transcriptional regulator [Synechococcaceae cyanobacterium]